MDGRLYFGEFSTHSAAEWRRFMACCGEFDDGLQMCFLAALKGAPDPVSPYVEANEIVALLKSEMEKGLMGIAIVAASAPSLGFARMLQMLLPEDAPFFVTTCEKEARTWLSQFSLKEEKQILLAA